MGGIFLQKEEKSSGRKLPAAKKLPHMRQFFAAECPASSLKMEAIEIDAGKIRFVP